MSAPRFNKTLATFARMWSAGMVPIFEKSGGWPGFRYSTEEQAGMKCLLDRFPKSMERFRIFAFVSAAITIVSFLILSIPMTLGLTALQHAHGQLPGVVIGAALGANTALGLGLGVPLGLYLSCALYQNFSWNADLTVADAEFACRLFDRFCQQATRLAAVVCAGLFLLSLWPNEESIPAAASEITPRTDMTFWERIAAPVLAGSINFMTFWYYYGKNRERT